jgi:glycosyltransferase involved in cell wall biosynthesis
MKVVHVPSIAAEASGPSYSIPALCRALARRDVDVDLHVLAPAPDLSEPHFTIRAHPALPVVGRLGISPAMRQALRSAATTLDVLHNHSLWMMPNVYPAAAVRGTRCKLVVSPRGTLSAWSLRRSKWSKRAFWWAGQGAVLRAAACFHATAEEEADDVRRAGFSAPIAVIPNGIELPLPAQTGAPPGELRRLLFLGRIHPVKGIDVLLRSWRAVQAGAPDWELVLAGPDEDGYLAKVQALAAELGVERVRFAGPVYGAEKSACYRQADLYVLPSRSENFGMTVAEALAHGIPAIVSKAAPWSGLDTHDCGWWVEFGDAPLTDCLRTALALSPAELRARGTRGRAWMERDFSWDGIGMRMHETYTWLTGGGMAPPWVRVTR